MLRPFLVVLLLSMRDVYVDPVNGNDANSGETRATAVRTLSEAWQRIPRGETLTTGYRIQLMAGVHPRDSVPTYFESRWGAEQAPIIIQSADGIRSARVEGDFNIFDTRWLYIIALDMRPQPAGDVIHCEKCDHLFVLESHLDGGARQAQETFKANQSQHVTLERNDIHGAYDNAIDFVAVQYGTIRNNRIWDAEDWCAYTKGGSAYVRVEGNEIFQCGTGGFSAGQGTGFQYMVAPWLHYEAYDIKVVNNFIHDTEGAGLGVNGGYNILLAHNTLQRVGSRSHMLEVTFGGRSCDGPPGEPTRERCAAHLAQGGWGNTRIADGENYTRIPNRNVFVYNNLLLNPPGFVSPQHFTVPEPYAGGWQIGTNAPDPAIADENLQIRGNRTVNEGEAGYPFNAAENSGATYPIPDFTWDDAPPGVPVGNLSNAVMPPRRRSVRD